MRLLPVALLLAELTLVAQARLPTPESVFGFPPGADYKLATYDQVVDYLKKIDSASDRVTLVEAGKTTQGRTFYFALVSSKNNLARIDRYREISRRLAYPDGLSEQDARALAKEGKAFVHIDGGLHSTELAGPQHTPELLHSILTAAESPEMSAILENVVLMLWPTLNPDGHQIVAEWFMKNAGTPQANAPLPVLYQEYVGHDNNRDAYMLNMVESRAIEHAWRQWEPQIVYVHHQSAPFPTRIWLPPFADPIATPRALSDVTADQHHRHGDRDEARRARARRRHAHGDRLRRLVSGLHRLPSGLQERRGVLDRDGRRAGTARFDDQRLSAADARPSAAQPLLEPVAARHVAHARSGRVHGNRIAGRARLRRKVQGIAAAEPLQIGSGADPQGRHNRAVRVLRPAGSSAIRSPRSNCCGVWPSAACGSAS